jgi:hypothetical protein
MEPVPNVGVPQTDVPFLDVEAIAEPVEVTAETAFTSSDPAFTPESRAKEPCADCAKYARIGYVSGVAIGVAAGGLVAYVILKNRLAPDGR